MDTNAKPWARPRWAADRLKELLWQSMSVPYLIALTLTVNFAAQAWLRTRDGPHAVNFQAMTAAWALAFARREWAAWMAGKQQPTVPPAVIK